MVEIPCYLETPYRADVKRSMECNRTENVHRYSRSRKFPLQTTSRVHIPLNPCLASNASTHPSRPRMSKRQLSSRQQPTRARREKGIRWAAHRERNFPAAYRMVSVFNVYPRDWCTACGSSWMRGWGAVGRGGEQGQMLTLCVDGFICETPRGRPCVRCGYICKIPTTIPRRPSARG